jgi:hypothetical protein
MVHLDHLREPFEDRAQAMGERFAPVGDDAPAADVLKARAALLDDPVSRDAEAGVDAEDADRLAQLKAAVV